MFPTMNLTENTLRYYKIYCLVLPMCKSCSAFLMWFESSFTSSLTTMNKLSLLNMCHFFSMFNIILKTTFKKTRGPLYFTIPSTSNTKHQFWQFGYWWLESLLVSFYYAYIMLCKTWWKDNRECDRENRTWYEVSSLCRGSGVWSLGSHSQDPGSIPSQFRDL